MVDVDEIKHMLHTYFFVYGHEQIDHHTGHVNVLGIGGHVVCKQQEPMSQLPVHWDKVDGDFHVNGVGLITLQGGPSHVGGYYDCSDNQLTDLTDAPVHVGKDFYCINNSLTNLTGAPLHVGGRFWVDYDPHLPLLRTLVAQQGVRIYNAPSPIHDILNKYVGAGKKGALACAAELVKAGYKENARW